MPNAWIEHVRKYAKDNNISYACAISKAKETYVKKVKTSRKESNLKLVELLKTLSGDDMVKLFTPTKRKSSYDLAGDRDVVIKKLLERFDTESDRQKVYDRVIKYTKNKKEQNNILETPKSLKVKESKEPDYIYRIHKKYPSTNISNLKKADEWIREKFIDNGFASNFEFAMHESVSIPTKRSLKSNPHGNQGKRDAQNNRSAQADAVAIVKPLIPTFHQAMKNAAMVEIFSNIIVDKHLIDILDADKIFKSTFSLTYNVTNLRTDTETNRQKIKDLVKQ